MKMEKHGKTKGFGMVEALVGTALIVTFLFGMAEAGKLSSRLIDGATARLQAVFLLEEGIDAVKGLRDTGWGANISLLSLGTDYWLIFSGGAWTLSLTPQPLIDGMFDRRVQIAAVNRNASDDIVTTGGSVDANTKKITVNVSWSIRGATTTPTISTYITNLFSN